MTGSSMSVVELPRVIPIQPGRPEWGDAARPIRALTRAIAMERDAWTPERAAQISSLFDSHHLPSWLGNVADRTQDQRVNRRVIEMPAGDPGLVVSPMGPSSVEGCSAHPVAH